VRRRIPVTHSIGLIGAEEAEREVAQVVSEGIRTIKIKVGVDPDRDVEMVRLIRETVGPGVALCVDANQGYRTPGETIRTSADGTFRSHLFRAAGRRHRAHGRGGAGDRHAGDGG
jgi:L-alanine-DL-glutamate epimerase-like enolase superfamily enzyme